jgi:WD40 repeat protein
MGNGVSKKDKQDINLLQSLEEHEGSVNCMALSDDGSLLASGSDDATIRIWSTKTDQVECIGILEGHDDYITCLLIEDSFILSSSADKTIKKWELASCECILTMAGHESTINKIVCTGDYVFSASYDKRVRMWDFDTGDCLKTFRGHKMNVTSLLFVPSDTDNFIKASRQNNSKLPPLPKLKSGSNVNSAYSKDIIITGSLDTTAKTWSVESGDCLHTMKGHTGPITCMATDPSGRLLFTGSADHDIRSWEVSTGQLIKILVGHQTTVLFLFVRVFLIKKS